MSCEGTGHKLTLFPRKPSTANETNQGNGSVQWKSVYFLNMYWVLRFWT